jgi:hypothetical protein
MVYELPDEKLLLLWRRKANKIERIRNSLAWKCTPDVDLLGGKTVETGYLMEPQRWM